jgi:hypothetical protein
MYKIQVYVQHGYFQYEVTRKDQAIDHAQAILDRKCYRRPISDDCLEVWPVYKVKIIGPDLGSKYTDEFKHT